MKLARRHALFALVAGEGDERDTLGRHEPMDGRDEALADRVHERRGRKRLPAVVAEEADDPAFALELRDVDVAVHAVDALHLPGDVLADDLGDGAW
jgi:hypothetical protein